MPDRAGKNASYPSIRPWHHKDPHPEIKLPEVELHIPRHPPQIQEYQHTRTPWTPSNSSAIITMATTSRINPHPRNLRPRRMPIRRMPPRRNPRRRGNQHRHKRLRHPSPLALAPRISPRRRRPSRPPSRRLLDLGPGSRPPAVRRRVVPPAAAPRRPAQAEVREREDDDEEAKDGAEDGAEGFVGEGLGAGGGDDDVGREGIGGGWGGGGGLGGLVVAEGDNGGHGCGWADDDLGYGYSGDEGDEMLTRLEKGHGDGAWVIECVGSLAKTRKSFSGWDGQGVRQRYESRMCRMGCTLRGISAAKLEDGDAESCDLQRAGRIDDTHGRPLGGNMKADPSARHSRNKGPRTPNPRSDTALRSCAARLQSWREPIRASWWCGGHHFVCLSGGI